MELRETPPPSPPPGSRVTTSMPEVHSTREGETSLAGLAFAGTLIVLAAFAFGVLIGGLR